MSALSHFISVVSGRRQLTNQSIYIPHCNGNKESRAYWALLIQAGEVAIHERLLGL